jgi:hypothetical protein
MAWTTPKTWADGDIPDADDLNTHIKDNLNVVSTHTHSGAAGDGSADLSGLDTQTFDNQGSTPAAPGSNKVKLFSESETLKIRAGASGAATALSLTSHSHSLSVTETAMDGGNNSNSNARSMSKFDSDTNVGKIWLGASSGSTSNTHVLCTVTDTFRSPSGDEEVHIVPAAGYLFDVTSGDSTVDLTFDLQIDNVSVAADVYGTLSSGNELQGALVGAGEDSGSVVYHLLIRDSDGSYGGSGGEDFSVEGYAWGAIDAIEMFLQP